MTGLLLALLTIGTAYDIAHEMTDDRLPMWRRSFWSIGHLVAAALLAGILTACVSPSPPAAPRPIGHDQLDTTARVEAFCVEQDPFEGSFTAGGGIGSGVIVDNRHVLTASHVVGISTGHNEWVPCPWAIIVHVTLNTGKKMRMVVAADHHDNDLAMLELATADSFHVAPPVMGPRPAVDATVCHASAMPSWRVDCGQAVTRYQTSANDVYMTAPVDHGNSGGPVYDDAGRLVGITTGLDEGGGFFTSLEGRKWR